VKQIEPCTLAVLGARGNLSRIKLIPALFRLESMNMLPGKMAILACGLESCSREKWLDEVSLIIKAKFPEGVDTLGVEGRAGYYEGRVRCAT
jgi:glucose-6-phosphate 1-dehydrogenase